MIFVFVWVLAGLLCQVSAGALTIRDKMGREVEVNPPVQRAVLLSLYELIPVLNLWDRVAGVNRWAYGSEALRDFPRVKLIPSVGTGDQVNVEALTALKPDLVITWTYKPEVVEFLAARGLKVIAIYPDNIDELFAAMKTCGILFGEESRTSEIISAVENVFEFVRRTVSKVPPERRQKVIWLWQKPTTVSGRTGITQDFTKLAGGTNLAESMESRYAEVSLERIVGWNPDVIFIWGNATYGVDDLLTGSQWKTVKAVKEGRVYKAPAWSSWSPMISLLTLWTACKMYPEYFDAGAAAAEARKFHMKCFGTPFGGSVPEW